LHFKKLAIATGEIAQIRAVIHEKLRKDEEKEKNILKALLENEEKKIREEHERTNMCKLYCLISNFRVHVSVVCTTPLIYFLDLIQKTIEYNNGCSVQCLRKKILEKLLYT